MELKVKTITTNLMLINLKLKPCVGVGAARQQCDIKVIVSVKRNVFKSCCFLTKIQNCKHLYWKFQAMKMTGTDNADMECGENKIEGEDSWRTVECLRGRLLAERMTSKNAREEADQLGIKLVDMERLLEQEEKSRNKAEKKLKLVMKKLEIVGKSKELNERSQVSSWSVSESKSSSSFGDEEGVDNSMAIVLVENERVKQVLESLRRAKEQLQSSMERRRMGGISMIKVG